MPLAKRLGRVIYCANPRQISRRATALRLDRARLAEMSCIAGVGGDVPLLVRRARSGRPILALDGCPLHCVKGCLARHEVVPTLHLTLSEHGLKKRYGEDCEAQDAERLFVELERLLTPGGKRRCE
ncbi:zinc-binding protein [Pseudomonas aeruginosa]